MMITRSGTRRSVQSRARPWSRAHKGFLEFVERQAVDTEECEGPVKLCDVDRVVSWWHEDVLSIMKLFGSARLLPKENIEKVGRYIYDTECRRQRRQRRCNRKAGK